MTRGRVRARQTGWRGWALWLAAGLALAALVACSPTQPGPPTTAQPAAQPASPTSSPNATPTAEARPTFSTSGWKTDFTRHSVPFSEVMPGGPPRDGIPPIDQPKLVGLAQGDRFLKEREPVIAFELGGEGRAYPLQILIWHEIVNDVVAGRPVLITFCPLCNTAIAFDRRLEGRVLDFGTTGNLRHSDLVTWDRQTESWWQQITGEAIVGELTGKKLKFLPASIVSWGDFKGAFPQGQVLSRETGHSRPYGQNPYLGYDDISQSPFLFRGPLDQRLPPMERVATVSLGGRDVAYPFRVLAREGVINHEVGGQPLAVFYRPGAASALDQAAIAASRDVGATGAYSPLLEGRRLTFKAQGEDIVDRETGSRWNILGQAVEGPLAGKRLEPILHANHFWFAWVVFKPQTAVYGVGG